MRPTHRFLKLVIAWTLLGIVASIWPVLQTAWIAAGIVVLVLALAVRSRFLFSTT
jgi:ABC-type multidrug transport system permease subunit